MKNLLCVDVGPALVISASDRDLSIQFPRKYIFFKQLSLIPGPREKKSRKIVEETYLEKNLLKMQTEYQGC